MFTPLTNPMPTPVFHPDKFREQFSQALRVQGKAKKTAKIYSDAVIAFHDFAQVHPLFATANDIRAFLYYLLREKKYAPRTFNQNLYGLKAFYGTYMPEIPIMAEFRRHKTNRRLVTVLSEGQVADMLEVCDNIKHQVMIALLYGTGIRVGECAGLTIVDFDKNEMLLHVVGKGEKDRYVMLPGSLLPILRQYYLKYRPKEYLFEGRYQHAISPTMIEHAVRETARRAGIGIKVTPHVLRHTFATQLLEQGYDISIIQMLLGHKHIRTTARYIHVRRDVIKRVKSPLDVLAEKLACKEAGNAK